MRRLLQLCRETWWRGGESIYEKISFMFDLSIASLSRGTARQFFCLKEVPGHEGAKFMRMKIEQTKKSNRKKKRGRPSKYNAAMRAQVLRSVKRGMPLVMAANAAAISYQTLCTYRTQHPQFAVALERAIAKGVEKRLEKIEAASDAGDWRASAWMLEHCQPEHFAKTRIQVEAIGQFDHAFVIPRETLDQIAEARAKHERESLNGNGSPAALPEIKPADRQ
jgi:hypothetical protein